MIDLQQPLVFQANQLCCSLGDTHILDNVSLTIHRCQHVKIAGGNGSGKSRLLRIVAAKSWPTAGERKYYFHNELIESPILAKTFIRLVSPEYQEHIHKMAISMTVREFVKTGFSDTIYSVYGQISATLEDNVDRILHELDLADSQHVDYMNISQGTLRRALIARIRRPTAHMQINRQILASVLEAEDDGI